MKLDMILAVIFVIVGAVWTILGEYPMAVACLAMAVACLAMANACRLDYELEKTKELIYKLHTKPSDNKPKEVK